MPYISQGDRVGIENRNPPFSAGELNYVITTAVVRYLHGDKVNYTALNEVIGVLECAKLELYRRMVAPYEDRKCAENGDVYDSVS